MGIGLNHEDTIVAVASPHGSARRGIVRASGPGAIGCFANAFQPDHGSAELSEVTKVAVISGAVVIDGVRVPGRLSVWPTEKSYTGQPSVEFHTFGSIPVLETVVKRVCRSGARPAEPGEFTMRAFLSGRLDLTQAEAVLAIIDAKDRRQLNVAIDQLAGGMGAKLSMIRTELLAALAELEAGLDFVEEDIEFISNDVMIGKLKTAAESLDTLLNQCRSRDSNNARFRVSLFGMPNAGKSTLFNCLLEKEVAIVANIEGTTTDRITADMNIGSQSIELVDTAGLELHDDADSISGQSQNQRREEIEQCELAVLCIDIQHIIDDSMAFISQVSEFESTNIIVVGTQADRFSDQQLEFASQKLRQNLPNTEFVITSSTSRSGLNKLKNVLKQRAIESQTSESGIIGSTMLRTEQSLFEAVAAIKSALDAANTGFGDEIVASELRLALDALGTIVGTVYTDDILDVVFGKFCIGK